MQASPQRVLVFSGVVAAHLAVLCIKISHTPTKNPENAPTTLIFIPISKQPAVDEDRAAKRTGREATRQRAEVENALPFRFEKPSSPDDWYDDAKASIDATISEHRKEGSYRRFEFKAKEPPPPLYEDVGKGIFDRGPAHEITGPIDLGKGFFKTWVDPYCYVISGIAPEGRIERHVCAEPGHNVDKHDMFAQFRPKYLDPWSQPPLPR